MAGEIWGTGQGSGRIPDRMYPKQELLEEAFKIVTGPRQDLYGKPSQNFIDTANMVDAYLVARGVITAEGKGIDPHDVAVIMICLKLARIATSPHEKDHWVDIAGYAACGWEAATEEGAEQ